MEEDLSLANEVWVGLGDDVEVVGWKKEEDGVLRVVVCLRERPVCGGCGGGVRAHGRVDARLADMPVFEAPVRLVGGNAGGGVRLRSARRPRSPTRPGGSLRSGRG